MSYAKRRREKDLAQRRRKKDPDLANVRNLIRQGKAPRLHFARNGAGRIVIRYTVGLFIRGRKVMEGKKNANG